ncbi:uncharacterized protein LOC141908442 [Tubulanus polymorphus]|uniref:uncharacterized protein LOC141908442 n=1 Tax=Tubulanus polymorphus TaxID=672921 RepID=UPI003DA45C77
MSLINAESFHTDGSLDSNEKQLVFWTKRTNQDDSFTDALDDAEDKTRICGVSPLTKAGKQIQMTKMMILTLIPIMALCVMCVIDLSTISKDNDAKTIVRDTIKFSMETAVVIHNLQRERDMTALYLSTLGAETRMFLRERYPDTDSAFESLTQWPKSEDKSVGLAQFNTRDDFLQYIRNHRAYLEPDTTDAYREILFYSNAIKIFIDWMYMSIQKSKDGEVWRSLVAYQLLVMSKEDMGIERTLGGVFYSRGSFEIDSHYLWYLEKHNVGSGNWQNAKKFIPEIQSIFDGEKKKYITTNNFTYHISNMRNEISRNNLTNHQPSWQMSTYWFDNMTIYIDILNEVQRHVANVILVKLNNSLKRDVKNLTVSLSVFILVIVICPLVITFVKAIMSDIQRYANTLSDQTKVFNQERHRTNSMLFQMLPKIVAEELKEGRHVIPEAYNDATVYFSDIVGFTKISANCTPIQVIQMLNGLYMCFDARIGIYDVYKVETIGDAYMIVSGVPKRNARKHLTEIASMALDLLHHVSHVEIPHMIGTKMQLRSGIHTGALVAGVVGSKMPRYCLFGDTVNTASRMEASGQPGRIHCSHVTYGGLALDPVFKFEFRGEMELKGKGMLKTYWLTDKEGFVESLACMPGCVAEAAGGYHRSNDPTPEPAYKSLFNHTESGEALDAAGESLPEQNVDEDV